MTPWLTGSFSGTHPELLFGNTYEDAAIELKAFAGKERAFCIAAAGDTAMELASAGHQVTAVDINPVQLAYARNRAAGGGGREGKAEQVLRALLRFFGWNREKAFVFAGLTDVREQVAFWRTHQSPIYRMWPLDLLKQMYAPAFLRDAPTPTQLDARLERCWSLHPNHSNPYARRLLMGEACSPMRAVNGIRFLQADAASCLETCPPASFDAFAISNILDGASEAYQRRIYTAIRRAATPHAVVVKRSFREPHGIDVHNVAPSDRSAIWGSVDVGRVEELCSIA